MIFLVFEVLKEWYTQPFEGWFPYPIDLSFEVVDGFLREGLVHQLILNNLWLLLRETTYGVLELLDGLCENIFIVTHLHEFFGEVDCPLESQSERQLPQCLLIQVGCASVWHEWVLVHVLFKVLQWDGYLLMIDFNFFITSLAHWIFFSQSLNRISALNPLSSSVYMYFCRRVTNSLISICEMVIYWPKLHFEL